MSADDVLAVSTADHLRRNGIPEPTDVADRQDAWERLQRLLNGRLGSSGLVASPLGVGWTQVFQARPSSPVTPAELVAAGWLSLAKLRRHLRLSEQGDWAVTGDSGRVLAAVRLAGRTEGPVEWIIQLATERGEVRLLDVLELRELKSRGERFPDASPVLTAAADIEIGLGRRDLVRWASGRRSPAPRVLPAHVIARTRRLVVAVSGVDGAGKTTVLDGLRRELERCAVPVSRVWLRPGMGLGWLTVIARWVKRRGGLDEEPGINRIAADPGATLASRRGALGWVWASLVTLSFIAGVRRQHTETRGVVLYDRHLVDALVTLEFAYRGVDLRVQRWLIRRLVPRADVTLHLDVPVQEAVRRKPGDQIGEPAVATQVAAYDKWLAQLPDVIRLDATAERGALVRRSLEQILTAG